MLDGNEVGVGVVFRDAQGQVVVVRAAVHQFWARWSVAIAEDMAAKFGLQEAQRTGYTRVKLECDAYNLASQGYQAKTLWKISIGLGCGRYCFA